MAAASKEGIQRQQFHSLAWTASKVTQQQVRAATADCQKVSPTSQWRSQPEAVGSRKAQDNAVQQFQKALLLIVSEDDVVLMGENKGG